MIYRIYSAGLYRLSATSSAEMLKITNVILEKNIFLLVRVWFRQLSKWKIFDEIALGRILEHFLAMVLCRKKYSSKKSF